MLTGVNEFNVMSFGLITPREKAIYGAGTFGELVNNCVSDARSPFDEQQSVSQGQSSHECNLCGDISREKTIDQIIFKRGKIAGFLDLSICFFYKGMNV